MQSVQRRLGRMRGEGRSHEEGVEQEAKVQQLTAELDQKTAAHNHLTEQIKRVHVRTHSLDTLGQFQSGLKTILFRLAYGA